MIILQNALVRSVDWIAARALLVVVGALLLAGVALVVTVEHLRIDTSTQEMISPEVPFRRHHTAFMNAFPAFGDTIVAVVEGATPERVEQAASALADALRADPSHFTAVDYPAGEAFFAANGLLFLSVDELAALSDRLAAAQPLLAALAEDPSLRGLATFLELAIEQGDLGAELDQLLGAMAAAIEAQLAGRYGELSWRQAMDGATDAPPSRAFVVAQPRLDHSSYLPAASAIAAVRSAAESLEIDADHGLRLDLTGAAVLDQEELEGVSSGASLAAVLATLAVAALLVWGLGSLRLIAATLITLAVGLVLTAAFATLAVGRLNLISVTFAVLFVGLGVDFGIHFVLRYQEAIKRGEGTRLGLAEAVAGVGGPLSLSALCAACGFLAFVPTDYRGLAEVGIISAAGMAIAWLTSLTLLPALLCLMPSAPRPRPARRWRLAPHTPMQHRVVAGAALIAGLAALPALPAVTFDFNPLNLKDPNAESMRVFERLAADPETSPYVVDLLAPTVADADRLATRLEALDAVGQTLTISSFVPDAQDEKLDLVDSLAFYLGPALGPPAVALPIGPEERERAFRQLASAVGAATEDGPGAARLAAALATLAPSANALAELEHRLTGTLPDLLTRLRQALEAGPVALDDLPAAIRDRWLGAAGQVRVLVRPAAPIRDNASLETFARAVLTVAPDATGTPVVVLEGGHEVVRAFREASWLALGSITLILALVLRNLRDVVLVLAPLALAVVLSAASAVALGLQLNFANVIVLPLLLGLGVSGALHVVMRWRQGGRTDDVATTSTPRAVLFSALTTIASFGSLALSAHRGLASMGLLLTIAILWSLISSLLVLPSVLALVSWRKPAG